MIAALFAVLAAASNAVASVLQRRAARMAPPEHAFRLSLVGDLARRPSWLGGIGALAGGFVLQATALSFGGLALVQPVLSLELPFTMILAAYAFHEGLGRVPWGSVVLLTGGLVALLAAAAPRGGRAEPALTMWMGAAAGAGMVMVGLVLAAYACAGTPRAVLLGVASSLGFAFTATLMKTSTGLFGGGIVRLLSSWPPYAMVGMGMVSLLLLQNALQSGSLIVVQPALTVSDPVVSILFGVWLFGERLRGGPWIIGEAFGLGCILLGSIGLARSPVLQEHTEVTAARRTRSSPRAPR